VPPHKQAVFIEFIQIWAFAVNQMNVNLELKKSVLLGVKVNANPVADVLVGNVRPKNIF